MTLERSSISAQQNLPNENAPESQARSGAELCGVGVAVRIFQNVSERPEHLPQLGPGLKRSGPRLCQAMGAVLLRLVRKMKILLAFAPEVCYDAPRRDLATLRQKNVRQQKTLLHQGQYSPNAGAARRHPRSCG